MANTQLTAYASAQLDKGVSREAITQALIGAGWMQADVEAAVAEVMQQRGGGTSVASAPVTETVVAQAQPEMTQPVMQQPMAQQPMTTVTTTTSPSVQPAGAVTPASFFATTPSMSMDATTTTAPKRSLTWLFVLVGILLAIGIIGGAAYALLGGSTDIEIPGANADELATLQQERDQLRAQVDSLTDNQAKTEAELALFIPAPTPTVEHTIGGRLSTSTAGAWIITTAHGIIVTISNAKEAGVTEALTPLKDAEVTITGTHAPGSTLMKVSAINGVAIVAPAAATTTTAPTLPGTR